MLDSKGILARRHAPVQGGDAALGVGAVRALGQLEALASVREAFAVNGVVVLLVPQLLHLGALVPALVQPPLTLPLPRQPRHSSLHKTHPWMWTWKILGNIDA